MKEKGDRIRINRDGLQPPLGRLGSLWMQSVPGVSGEIDCRYRSRQNIYKYNRKIEHDQYQKRSTGTKRGGKSKTYLNRENHCVFTLREKFGLT